MMKKFVLISMMLAGCPEACTRSVPPESSAERMNKADETLAIYGIKAKAYPAPKPIVCEHLGSFGNNYEFKVSMPDGSTVVGSVCCKYFGGCTIVK